MTESIATNRALPDDLRYIVSLMRSNRESVGGLPVPAIQERLTRGTVWLCRVDGDPVGYVLFDVRSRALRVPQACIQYDARRRKYGVALVGAVLAAYAESVDEIALRCAADLEANTFWREMGFTCIGSVPGGKRRGRTINLWTMWLRPKLVDLADVAAVPVSEYRQDAMYDDSGYASTGVLLPKLAWSNRPSADPQLDLGLVRPRTTFSR
jgi:hypothetical protein